jgi:hypothetical protein
MSDAQVSTDLDFFQKEYGTAKAAFDKAKKAADQAKVRSPRKTHVTSLLARTSSCGIISQVRVHYSFKISHRHCGREVLHFVSRQLYATPTK